MSKLDKVHVQPLSSSQLYRQIVRTNSMSSEYYNLETLESVSVFVHRADKRQVSFRRL